MHRLFGSSKPKEPPPNLTDCIANVSCMSDLLLSENMKNDYHCCTIIWDFKLAYSKYFIWFYYVVKICIFSFWKEHLTLVLKYSRNTVKPR